MRPACSVPDVMSLLLSQLAQELRDQRKIGHHRPQESLQAQHYKAHHLHPCFITNLLILHPQL